MGGVLAVGLERWVLGIGLLSMSALKIVDFVMPGIAARSGEVNSELLPASVLGGVAVAELLAGGCILCRRDRIGALIAVGLFSGFLAYTAFGMVVGRDHSSCGCLGRVDAPAWVYPTIALSGLLLSGDLLRQSVASGDPPD